MSSVDQPIRLFAERFLVGQVRPMPAETAAMLAPYALSLHLEDYRLDPHPHLLRGHGRYVNIILEQWMPPVASAEESLRKEAERIRGAVALGRISLSQIRHECANPALTVGESGFRHAARIYFG